MNRWLFGCLGRARLCLGGNTAIDLCSLAFQPHCAVVRVDLASGRGLGVTCDLPRDPRRRGILSGRDDRIARIAPQRSSPLPFLACQRPDGARRLSGSSTSGVELGARSVRFHRAALTAIWLRQRHAVPHA